MHVPELFDFRGQAGRSTFGMTLILGALVLHNIYRIAAASVTALSRAGFGYLFPMSLFYGPRPVSADEQRLLWMTVALAIPFLWVAVCVTVKRLRDLGPVLLFVPAINVLFFVLLCVVPGLDKQQEAKKKGQSFLLAILPASKWGSAVVGAFAGTAVGTLLAWFSVALLGGYASVLFLALPFFMGFISAWLYGYHEPRSSGECYAVAMASVFLTGAIIVGIAFEGIICVGMAAPLAIPLALLGARLGYEGLQTRHLRIQPKALCGLFLVIPLLMGAEFRMSAPVPTHTPHSSVEIAAPPNAVWQRVVAFPRIQERPQWIFRLGMAYPLEVRTRGTGLSASGYGPMKSCGRSSCACSGTKRSWRRRIPS